MFERVHTYFHKSSAIYAPTNQANIATEQLGALSWLIIKCSNEHTATPILTSIHVPVHVQI